jgi:uncharacterized membrane protein YebE (DUF533 family)
VIHLNKKKSEIYMSADDRSTALVQELLGLHAREMPAGAKFGAAPAFIGKAKEFVQNNKKLVTIGAVILGAVVIYAGYQSYKKNHPSA